MSILRSNLAVFYCVFFLQKLDICFKWPANGTYCWKPNCLHFTTLYDIVITQSSTPVTNISLLIGFIQLYYRHIADRKCTRDGRGIIKAVWEVLGVVKRSPKAEFILSGGVLRRAFTYLRDHVFFLGTSKNGLNIS